MMGSGAIAFQILTVLIFSILGLTAEDPRYPLRFILIAILALVGGLTGIIPQAKYKRPIRIIAAGLEGLLCSFFLGGVFSNLNSMIATFFGMVGMMAFLLGATFAYPFGFGVIVSTIGVVFANGMCFIAGANALHAGFVGQWEMSLAWSLISVIYLSLTLQNLKQLYYEVSGRVSGLCT